MGWCYLNFSKFNFDSIRFFTFVVMLSSSFHRDIIWSVWFGQLGTFFIWTQHLLTLRISNAHACMRSFMHSKTAHVTKCILAFIALIWFFSYTKWIYTVQIEKFWSKYRCSYPSQFAFRKQIWLSSSQKRLKTQKFIYVHNKII